MKKLFLFFAALCCSLMTFGGQVFHSLICVEDNSVADWDQVPEEYLFECSTAPNAVNNALKSVKVYADAMYINIYVTWDQKQITDLGWVPFHIFLDADNSDATGGYGDEFADPNSEWMLEGGIIYEGASNNYDPAVFKWWGEVGGNGWEWVDPDTGHTDADFWGAIIGEGQGSIGQSQLIGDNGCEIQLLREAATCITWNATTFGIGFDIQQNWSSVGVLPNADADEVGSEVLAAKMKVTIDNEGYEDYDIIEGDLSYRTLSESTVSVSSCDSDAKIVTIPSSIVVDGVTYLVTTIGYRAFEGCTNLSSVTIPNSVTTIGYRAFKGCTGLTSIIIPKSVATIEEEAFYGCYSLTKVEINSDTYLSQDFSSKYEQRPSNVFGSQVTEYVIGNSVKTIGVQAFRDCSRLTSVTIGNSVTTIGEAAFYDCSGLTSVTIGNSVTSIGDEAFDGCKNIRKITCFAKNPPICGTSVFSSLSQYTKAYVLASSLEDYQFANVWRDLNLYPIESEVVPLSGDQPIVTPTDQDVTITWPITDGTDTYTLTITKNGETVCVLTFNANGQLTNIAFAAPGHNGAHQAPAATLTAQGYQFTVTGLTPSTNYNYSVTATDAGGKTLAEHKGNFSTTGGTGFESVHGSQCTMHKVLRNGQILLERNNATYTLMGQKVK